MGKLMAAVLVLGLMSIAVSGANAVITPIQYNICSGNVPVSADGFFNIDVHALSRSKPLSPGVIPVVITLGRIPCQLSFR